MRIIVELILNFFYHFFDNAFEFLFAIFDNAKMVNSILDFSFK